MQDLDPIVVMMFAVWGYAALAILLAFCRWLFRRKPRMHGSAVFITVRQATRKGLFRLW